MGFFCVPLSETRISDNLINADKKGCLRYGPCGIGVRAIFLNGRFLDRRFYIAWEDVKRVYKRVAMSPGGFSGKGVFGSMPFLVVEYTGGQREFPFKIEDDVDRMLDAIHESHPEIPTYSIKAKRRLQMAEAAEEAKYIKDLPADASAAVDELNSDIEFLNERRSLCDALVSAARQKRVVDNLPLSFRLIGIILSGGGIIAIIYGIIRWLSGGSHPLYVILGGALAFTVALTSNSIPSKWNSKQRANQNWLTEIERMKTYLEERPSFKIPAHYAHPTVLLRMVKVIREGRAESIEDAYSIMKDDLKALNSSVTVSKKEHDEVVEIKPLFLAADYKDEL